MDKLSATKPLWSWLLRDCFLKLKEYGKASSSWFLEFWEEAINVTWFIFYRIYLFPFKVGIFCLSELTNGISDINHFTSSLAPPWSFCHIAPTALCSLHIHKQHLYCISRFISFSLTVILILFLQLCRSPLWSALSPLLMENNRTKEKCSFHFLVPNTSKCQAECSFR